MNYRFAMPEDVALLAQMNQQLIQDEGHRNPMNLEQLTERMRLWLRSEYRAVLFEFDQEAIGYALFRRENDEVYIRHFFVSAEFRRQGIGRNAMHWLRQNVWADALRMQIDVLANNNAGHDFWRAVGFRDYSITMEADLQHPKKAVTKTPMS